MKKNHLFWVTFVVTTITFGQTIFINEIHYDNDGGDVDEGIEICGPAGTNLAGYEVYLYNGDGSTYAPTSISLSGIIPNQQNNRGTLWFVQVGIQNGSPDGLALVDASSTVLQFLSYEGVITATAGVAVGLTSTDIGVLETAATTPIGYSLQLIGSGIDYTDFTWFGPTAATPGTLNSNQTLSVVKNEIEGFSLYPNPVLNGKLFMSSNSRFNQQVEIFSMVGKCVYKKEIQFNETIDVSYLTSGIYMVKIKEGARIATRKLIVK